MPLKVNTGLLIDGIGVLASVAEAVPLFGAPVKGSMDALKQILQCTQEVKNNKQDSIALANHAGEIASQLFVALKSLDDRDSMKANLESFVNVLEAIADFTKERATRKTYFGRATKKQGDADEIKRMDKELTRASERFNIKALLDNKAVTAASRIWEKEKRERELLDLLKPVKAAFSDHVLEAAPACHQGTRVGLLASITSWMNNPSSEPIYWLSGAAGTGKTTVAQSVSIIAQQQGLITSTFFFSRATDDRRDYGSVIPTLAYQLATNDRIRSLVCAAVAADNDICVRPVGNQVQRLLVDVLTPLISESPPRLLLILDALDESKEDHVKRVHGGTLIPLLLDATKHIPFARILITSRPESSIERLFSREAVGDTIRPLILHRDIPKQTVQADIELYIRAELSTLKLERSLAPGFASDVDIRTLVQHADGLFIYARTAVEFISDHDGTPEHRLGTLTRAGLRTTSRTYDRLDNLYSYILSKALRITLTSRHIVDQELRNLLVALVLVQEEVSCEVLAVLADLGVHKCAEFLRRISAVLNYQHGTPEPVRLIHSSFLDFVSDSTRWSDSMDYGVNIVLDHLHLTERCFELLIAGLHHNMCEIEDPSLFNHEVSNLRSRLDRYVSETLRYSCKNWILHLIQHLRAAGLESRVPRGLDRFCSEHVFHWIEVLSLTGCLSIVHRAMTELIGMLKVNAVFKNSSMLSILSDAHLLMRNYRAPISMSALQVYHSALVVMPECALRKMAPQLNIPKLISQRDLHWQHGLLILDAHLDGVNASAFSSDCQRIVSGSNDKTVRIWDAVSGVLLHTMTGHTSEVTNVTFSSDDQRVVSGSWDGTVRVWDAALGGHCHTLRGHTSSVTSIGISTDCRWIVSGSNDHTIQLWDAVSGIHQHTIYGHSSPVTLVAFSSDGLRIVSGSDDRTIRVWDSASGRPQYTLRRHSKRVTSVAFSHDGRNIVSSSSDGTLCVWNTDLGTHPRMLTGYMDWITSVAFSADALWIVAGSVYGTVDVWAANSNTHRHTLNGHTKAITCVIFSFDSLQIVSGSDDSTVRVWNVISGALQHTLKGHSDMVTSVSISSDGLQIVSSSRDNTVRVWDTILGMQQQPLPGHADRVKFVALLPDGQHVITVSASHDHTLWVWSVVSGLRLHILQGHTDEISHLAVSPDSTQIVSGSFDHTLRVWDVIQGQLVHTMIHHQSPVTALEFTADGMKLFSFHVQGKICIWNTMSGVLQHLIDGFDPAKATLQEFVSASLHEVIPLYAHDPDTNFTLDAKEGWVSRRSPDGVLRRLCWLPHERRHEGTLASSGQRVGVGAFSGAVTILDFSDV